MLETDIQIKRGNIENLPVLKDGEMALTLDTGEVFVGSRGKNISLAKKEDLITEVYEVPYEFEHGMNKYPEVIAMVCPNKISEVGKMCSGSSICGVPVTSARQPRYTLGINNEEYGRNTLDVSVRYVNRNKIKIFIPIRIDEISGVEVDGGEYIIRYDSEDDCYIRVVLS